MRSPSGPLFPPANLPPPPFPFPPPLGQLRPRRWECPDAGKPDSSGLLERVEIGGEPRRGADLAQGALHGPDVAHAVVDDRDHGGPPKNRGGRGADFLGSITRASP